MLKLICMVAGWLLKIWMNVGGRSQVELIESLMKDKEAGDLVGYVEKNVKIDASTKEYIFVEDIS